MIVALTASVNVISSKLVLNLILPSCKQLLTHVTRPFIYSLCDTNLGLL